MVGNILEACEFLGAWPSASRMIIFAMLPKPAGGFRPIVLFPSLYRLWTKVRVCFATDWMARHDRPYIACGPGRSPEQVVWRRAIQHEACCSSAASTRCPQEQEEAATLLWGHAEVL